MWDEFSLYQCTFVNAKDVLPHIGHQLTTLDLLETSNSQAVWLLRTGIAGGILPRLRSLGIQLRTSTHSKDKAENGHGWREDEHGRPSQDSRKRFQRYFDSNYIMSIAKAAPNLEELDLMGPSYDQLVSNLSPRGEIGLQYSSDRTQSLPRCP